MNKGVLKATSGDQSVGKNKQAERSAQSDKKMFEAAIELINERGTAKQRSKISASMRAIAEDWQAIALALKTVFGWSYSISLMISGRPISLNI